MTAEEFDKRMAAIGTELDAMHCDTHEDGWTKGRIWRLLHDLRYDMRKHFRQHEPPCGDAYELPVRVRRGAEEAARHLVAGGYGVGYSLLSEADRAAVEAEEEAHEQACQEAEVDYMADEALAQAPSDGRGA